MDMWGSQTKMNIEIVFDVDTLVLGLIIFVARVTDVTLGTLRTVSIVQGRTKMAFFLTLNLPFLALC